MKIPCQHLGCLHVCSLPGLQPRPNPRASHCQHQEAVRHIQSFFCTQRAYQEPCSALAEILQSIITSGSLFMKLPTFLLQHGRNRSHSLRTPRSFSLMDVTPLTAPTATSGSRSPNNLAKGKASATWRDVGKFHQLVHCHAVDAKGKILTPKSSHHLSSSQKNRLCLRDKDHAATLHLQSRNYPGKTLPSKRKCMDGMDCPSSHLIISLQNFKTLLPFKTVLTTSY